MEVTWMPYELRPYPSETLKPEGEYLQSTWKSNVYPMAASMGVKIQLPKVSPQPHTHLAFEGFQYAKEKGKGNEYNHRVFTAFFQDDLDIGDVDVLTAIIGALDLPENEFREALQIRKYKEIHQKELQHAYYEANIQAVPTFFIGDIELPGVRSKEVLERAINEELVKSEKHNVK